VHDKGGKPVDSLTAADFTLTEDGQPQKIRFCEHQSLPLTENPLPVLSKNQEKVTIYKSLNRSQIAPEATERLHYKDRRLLASFCRKTYMSI
jgi:hypothetical protein